MSARFDRLVRAYRPLYLRGSLVEGGGRPASPPADKAQKPARLSLLAGVALALPRRDRGKR